MRGNVILFEDDHVDDMSPITLTRPAFAVTCAAYTLHEIAAMAADNVSYIVRDYLKEIVNRCTVLFKFFKFLN